MSDAFVKIVRDGVVGSCSRKAYDAIWFDKGYRLVKGADGEADERNLPDTPLGGDGDPDAAEDGTATGDADDTDSTSTRRKPRGRAAADD